jgi:hypothetical protein
MPLVAEPVLGQLLVLISANSGQSPQRNVRILRPVVRLLIQAEPQRDDRGGGIPRHLRSQLPRHRRLRPAMSARLA